ncbi:hypothetical protein SAMN02745121_06366 [Nannocystis exedens]|uniref:Lipoprotein n=1 Tax=Nannocystis exedens TaxID=54 RepID=A0A1I2F028_9BACT|nr:hypothetical protein [Nannocystis exedens]SFE98323.1 hypothetical protein SAMN02745121_06366 [Nannocystis exedens]
MPTSRALLLTLAGLFAACAGKSNPPPADNPDGQKACTMEAKLCPDGSAVGRTGPNCEFAPCPGPASDAPASDAPAPPPGEPQNAAPPSP